MRVPLSWLAEYVDLPSDATPEGVMAELVKVGLEEEGTHGFDVTGPVVVGQVIEFTPEEQSNGKTIRWCQVRVAPVGAQAADGGEDVRGIVCGASNFEVGDKVVVCLPGAVLPGGFAIAARKTYGHVSDGMMASSRELGLSDDHAGIIRLHELGLDPKVGADALELLQLSETAAEVNVTPDRGYCFSIRGVAREYSHATGCEFRDPIGNAHPEAVSGFALTMDDKAPIRDRIGSEHFTLRAVRNIDASRPTPPWMVARLKLAGMRSISLVVDITNYVMLELGQPLHAYDLDKLVGGITVRRALAGETLKTLDGQERKLDPEDLLICDDAGPIGLAGVMGGERTEFSTDTKHVLIEAAHFDPISIARSARRHKLPSEASKRFERGVDPNLGPAAVARVVQLLEVHAHGEADSLGAEVRAEVAAKPIWLPEDFASIHVGVEYSSEEISSTLQLIGCVVAVVDGGFEVIAPSWRPDLTHKTDLVEEVARITGYDRIPSRIPVAPPGRGLTQRQRMRRSVLNQLAAPGMVEVLNYPFLGEAANKWFGQKGAAVTLANALQGDAAQMRTSILPGLLESAKRNISRGLTDVALVEEGTVFLPAPGKAVAELPSGVELPSAETLALLNASIPEQPRHLGIVLTGNRVAQQVNVPAEAFDYTDALAAARTAAHAVGVDLEVRQAAPQGFHSGRTAELSAVIAGEQIRVGYAGELDPTLAASIDLPRRVAVVELDLEKLYAAAPAVVTASHVHTMPAATQDLSLVVDLSVVAGELQNSIADGAGSLLESIRLVDDYRGANLTDGKKSLTFALRFRAADRTLTQAEASEARDAAVKLVAERFGAELRA